MNTTNTTNNTSATTTLETTSTRQSCTDGGREHEWEPRGSTKASTLLVYACKACGAWGWVGWQRRRGRIRVYKEAFTDPNLRPGPPEPNVLTAEQRKCEVRPELARSIDRRGDTLPRKKGLYTPRYTLEDWDRMPGRRGG